jgi:hypothetical protein
MLYHLVQNMSAVHFQAFSNRRINRSCLLDLVYEFTTNILKLYLHYTTIIILRPKLRYELWL